MFNAFRNPGCLKLLPGPQGVNIPLGTLIVPLRVFGDVDLFFKIPSGLLLSQFLTCRNVKHYISKPDVLRLSGHAILR
jgi:hypothetical protein